MKTNHDYDAVIVGAGVSGALVACKLAEAGCSVLLLDAGEKFKSRSEYVKIFSELTQKDRLATRPFRTDEANKFAHSADGSDLKLNSDPAAPFGPNKYYDQQGPKPFKSQYVRVMGGSTWAWRGNAPRFLPTDFKLKSHFPKLSQEHPGVDDWPIDYDELEPWYVKAEKEMGIAGDDDEYDGLFGAHRSEKFPMEKIAQSYGDLQLINALKKAPEKQRMFDGVELQIFGLVQARNSRDGYNDRQSCKGNNNCIPICPTGAKYDGSIHLNNAERLGAKIFQKSVVTRLEADPNGNISKVWYKNWDKEEKSVTGRIVVLAAHAIETPKILLMSNGVAQTAKDNGIVGAYLMDHLGGEGAALMPFRVFPFRGPQSTSCIESFRNHKYRSEKCAFRMTIGNDGWGRGKHPYDNLNDLLKRKLFGEELKDELYDIITRQLRIAYTTEQLPDKNNRVELADESDELGVRKPRIRFNVNDYSFRGMEYAQEVIKHIFKTVGADELEWEFSDLKSGFYSGSAHIMGTCRMGTSQNTSVVDPNCRSFEHKNLYIVDSSVFVTGAPTNPTITTAALALRAAEMMRKELGH